MDQAATPRIRNVALVGHSGAGKTTLAEALLHRAGVIPRLGRVEDGTTVCDTEPEETRRGSALSPTCARDPVASSTASEMSEDGRNYVAALSP